MLGSFPKSYHLDYNLVLHSINQTTTNSTNEDINNEINKLLDILLPLQSNNIHLCLYGCGNDYYTWYINNYSKQLTNNSKPIKNNSNNWNFTNNNSNSNNNNSNNNNINTIIELQKQEIIKLNNISLFLIQKKLFKNISILEDGYIGALKYLYHTSSMNGITSNLIDINITIINSIFNIDNSIIGTSIIHNNHNNENLLQTDDSHEQTPANATSTNNWLSGYSWAKPVDLTNITKSLQAFGTNSLENIKKVVNVNTNINNNETNANGNANNTKNTSKDNDFVVINKKNTKGPTDKQSAFVIDDEDDDEDETDNDTQDTTDNQTPINQRKSLDNVDSIGVSIKKTDTERQQALILHKLAGLRKLDNITITKEYLPGAILFPCHKYKIMKATEDNDLINTTETKETN